MPGSEGLQGCKSHFQAGHTRTSSSWNHVGPPRASEARKTMSSARTATRRWRTRDASEAAVRRARDACARQRRKTNTHRPFGAAPGNAPAAVKASGVFLYWVKTFAPAPAAAVGSCAAAASAGEASESTASSLPTAASSAAPSAPYISTSPRRAYTLVDRARV